MNMKFKKSDLFTVGLFILLLHPFYVYLLNNINKSEMILLFLSILFLVISFPKIKIKSFRYIIPWLIFILYLIVNNVGDYTFLLYHMVAIIFALAMINFEEEELYDKFIYIIIFLSLIHAFTTIFIYIFPSLYDIVRPLIVTKNIMYAGYRTGLTGHYSTNAIYITIGLIASFFIIFKKDKIYLKNILLILIYIIALLLTTKRGPLIFSVISIIITIACIFYNKAYKKRVIKIVVTIAILLMFFFIFGGNTVISGIVNRFKSDGDSGRETLYSIAIDMFHKKSIFGNGTGYFKQNYYSSNDPDLKLNVHNVYAQLLCENGIIGLVFFLAPAISTLLISVVDIRLKLKDKKIMKRNTYLLAVSICYQLYFLLYSFTGNTIYDNMVFIPYYIFCSYTYYLLMYDKIKEE